MVAADVEARQINGGRVVVRGHNGVNFARTSPAIRTRPIAYRSYARQRGVYSPYAFGQTSAYRRSFVTNRRDWNRNIGRRQYRPTYYSYYGGSPYYYSSYYPTYYSDYSYYTPTAFTTTSYVAPRYTFAVAGSSTVVSVQQQLARAGYYRGPIDGIMGPMTRSAILRFERDRGLPPSAAINTSLLISLGLA